MMLAGCKAPNGIREVEWTVAFDFPDEIVYPSELGGFQRELDEGVTSWANKKEAEDFAKERCGKYGWTLVPTVMEITNY